LRRSGAWHAQYATDDHGEHESTGQSSRVHRVTSIIQGQSHLTQASLTLLPACLPACGLPCTVGPEAYFLILLSTEHRRAFPLACHARCELFTLFVQPVVEVSMTRQLSGVRCIYPAPICSCTAASMRRMNASSSSSEEKRAS